MNHETKMLEELYIHTNINNMNKILPLTIITGVALLLSGCATLFTGTTQSVTIDSQPQGANIVVDGQFVGTTPARVRLNRDLNAIFDDGKFIRLEMDGYVPDGYILGADIEPFSVLNTFIPFFWAVDAITGALMRYDGDYYNFMLIPYDADPSYIKQSYGSQANPPYMQQNNQQETVEEVDNYEKLMRLVDLYEEGLLTKEEFDIEKAKIFNK